MEKVCKITTMKSMEFRYRGKRYRIRPAGVVLIVILLLLFTAGAAALIGKLTSADTVSEEETSEQEDYDASAGEINKTEYSGTLLEETEDAGQSYIESILFLGDSNTARFLNEINAETKKTFAAKENAIGVVGMGVDAITTLACMDFSTGRFTMPQSVAILQPERVIITMGTNNLSGTSTDASSFIERYQKGIQAIEAAYPSVDIIVNSIPPVARTTSYTNVSMKQIDAYNAAIVKMCKQNGWKYLNSAEALKDETTGWAKEGYTISADGLHLSNQGIAALFKYIRTHSYVTEDDRPKPLNAIPAIIGVPEGLIRTDPLTSEAFKEDPSLITETMEPESTPAPEATETPEPVESSEPTALPTPEAAPSPSSTPESEGEGSTETAGEPAETAAPSEAETQPQEEVSAPADTTEPITE